MLKETKRETKPHNTVNLLLGTIKLILVSWLLSFSLNVSESPLPHQGAWDSAGYPTSTAGWIGYVSLLQSLGAGLLQTV